MKISKNYFFVCTVIYFFMCMQIQARVVLTGDSSAVAGESFSFAILPHVMASNSALYIGRLTTPGASNAATDVYSLSVALAGYTDMRPLAPEKVILNGSENSDNPLYAQGISTLGLYRDAPLVVRGDAPQHIYWIASGPRSIDVEVLSAENSKDADGNTTAGIVKTTGGSYIFAALAPQGGNFGDNGSGVALFQRNQSSLEQIAALTLDNVVKAVPIDVSSSFLKITSDLAAINSQIIDMHWDATLERLYVALKATGNTGATDGARSIFVGYLTAEKVGDVFIPKLQFVPFAPADAFTGTTYVVGAVGANVVAETQMVRTMHTSTGVSYLITLGNAAGTNVQKTVTALPLVDKSVATAITDVSWKASTDHGTLASKTISAGTNLQTYYTQKGEVSLFRGRGFQVAATDTAHLTAQTDTSAQVGGALAPANVVALQVHKDTVFVSCLTNDDQVRVYASQALFDADGAISAWTPWQTVMRSLTGTDQVYGIGYQAQFGRLYTIEGASVTAAKRVVTSSWSHGAKDGLLGGTTADASVGFSSLVQNSFLENVGGLQGLFDIPRQTTAFNQTTGNRCSWVVATGYKKIVIVETGQDNASNDFVPHIGSFDHADNIIATNGAIATAATSNTKMITVSGGLLDTIGAITSVAIANDATNGGYLIVAGVGGCALLCDTSGNGWSAGNMRKSFSTLGTNKSFVALGNYAQVRKLVVDGDYLYILTPNTLDRIPVNQLNGTPTATTLATPVDVGLKTYDSFSDVLISNKLALLATSDGLYRTGNGKNTQTETSAAAMSWTRIPLAQSTRGVTRLYGRSTTFFETDVAQQTGGGNVYALAASVNEQNASVHRFAIADISATAITDTTVVEIPDIQVQGITGPFAQLGAYRNFFATDGALQTMSRSLYNGTQSVFQTFPAVMNVSLDFNRNINTLSLHENQKSIKNVVHNFALGSLIVPTDNGLQILE